MPRHTTRKGTPLKDRRYEEALESFNKSIALKPDNAQAWYDKGSTLLKSEQFWPAIDAFDQAIGIYPNYVNAYFNKGLALAKTGGIRRGPQFDQAVAIDPTHTLALYHRGATLFKKERYPMPLRPTTPCLRSPHRIRRHSMKRALPSRTFRGSRKRSLHLKRQ